ERTKKIRYANTLLSSAPLLSYYLEAGQASLWRAKGELRSFGRNFLHYHKVQRPGRRSIRHVRQGSAWSRNCLKQLDEESHPATPGGHSSACEFFGTLRHAKAPRLATRVYRLR